MDTRRLLGLRPGERTGLGTPGLADGLLIAAGSGLLLLALRRRAIPTALLGLVRAGLVYRGATGASFVDRSLEQGG